MQPQQQRALDSLLQQQEWSSYRKLINRYGDRRLALHLIEQISWSLAEKASHTPSDIWPELYQQLLQRSTQEVSAFWRFILRLSQPSVPDEVQVIARRLQAIRKAAVYGSDNTPADSNELWLKAIRRSYHATLWLIVLLFLLYWGLVG